MKRAITNRDHSITHIKTFSEILHTRKKRQDEQQEQSPSPKKAKHTVENAPGKSQGECNSAGPCHKAINVEGVRVKTLEEIRREKAARLQAQQAHEAENKKSSDTENGAKKPRLLRIKKLASQSKAVLVLSLCSYVPCVLTQILHTVNFTISISQIELHFEFGSSDVPCC